MNTEEFRKAGYKVIDDIAKYYDNLDDLNAPAKVKPGFLAPLLPDTMPEKSENFEEFRDDFYNKIMPGVTHWQSANFFSYFPSSVSYASMLADMYCNMLTSQGFDWICNPAGTELEGIVINWLGKLLGLDDAFFSNKGKGCGSIHSTASEGTLVTMVAARNRVLKLLKSKGELENDDKLNTSKLVMYSSDQAHSSFAKNAKILNLRIKPIETDETGTMQPQALRKQILSDIKEGLIPFYTGLCYGTTTVGSVDNILGCIPVAQEFGLWTHVDAAWAGAFLMLPQYQTLNGLKECDTIVFNPHKMMLTHFDCTALWIQNKYELIESLTSDASYYKNYATKSGQVIDLKDLEVPMGRGFRALKLWFVMRNFGSEGLQSVMTSALDLAQYLVDLIEGDQIFEVTHPTLFSLVCFRLKPINSSESLELTNRRNQWIFDKLFEHGKFMIAHATFREKYFFRVSSGNTHNTTKSLLELYTLMKGFALQVDQFIS